MFKTSWLKLSLNVDKSNLKKKVIKKLNIKWENN